MDTTSHVLPDKISEFDYKVGASGLNMTANNWLAYKSTDEPQSGVNGDKDICMTEANNQGLETDLIAQQMQNQIPAEHLEFLKSNGYIDANGKIRFNNRISAILNGTTKEGNNFGNVIRAVRNYGLFPWSILLDDPGLSWDNYFDRTQISQPMLDLGKKFLVYFTPFYQWVWTGGGERINDENLALASSIVSAPIQIVTPICPTWNSGTVQACGSITCQHSTLMQKVNGDYSTLVQDHFVPFEKTLAADYPIPYAMQVFCRPNDLNTFSHNFTVDLRYENSSDPKDEIVALQCALFKLGLFYDSLMPTLAQIQSQNTPFFGPITLAAVRAFQGKHSLPETGFVGPLTRAALNTIFNQ